MLRVIKEEESIKMLSSQSKLNCLNVNKKLKKKNRQKCTEQKNIANYQRKLLN